MQPSTLMREGGANPTGPSLPTAMFLCLALLTALPAVAGAATTERVSVITGGTQITEQSSSPSISADGRFVAFTSRVFVDSPSGNVLRLQVFVHDRSSNVTDLVSVAPDGITPGNFDSSSPSISANGSVVAFVSLATNLTTPGTNGTRHVFVRDRTTGTTELVSMSSGGISGNHASDAPAISGNGLAVVFVSSEVNLAPNISLNGRVQVFLRNRVLATTEVVSLAAGTTTTAANGDCQLPAISGDGHYVVFESRATNLLVTGSTSGDQFFVRDMIKRRTELVGEAIDPTSNTSAAVQRPSISSDGRFVAFARTRAVQTGGTFPTTTITSALSVRDRLRATTQMVTQGTPATTSGFTPSISADGRFVAFESRHDDTCPGICLRDLATGTRETVSINSNFAQANGGNRNPSTSADGSVVAFESLATNLVSGDTNGSQDVFVRDRQTTVGLPQLSLNDVSKQEGAAGTTTAFTFTVSLSPASSFFQPVTVNFWTDSGPAVTSPMTLGGTATSDIDFITSGNDFTATSGTLTFSPGGKTALPITVNVIGDNVFERLQETFVVNLDVPRGAVIARSPGIGTIVNDDLSLGTAELTPETATVAVRELLTYTVTWTVPPPLNWHDLQSVQLRISDEAGTVLWVSFDEAAGTFSLLNTAGQPVGRAFLPGHPGRLQSNAATVYMRDSSVQGSGPTGPSVTLFLDVSFKPQAAGRTYVVEVLAIDDAGDVQIEPAGTLTVTR